MSHWSGQPESELPTRNGVGRRFPTRDNRDAPRGRMTGPERGEHPSDSPATDRDIGPSPPVGGLGTYRAMIRLDGSEVVDIALANGVLSCGGCEVSIETMRRIARAANEAANMADRDRSPFLKAALGTPFEYAPGAQFELINGRRYPIAPKLPTNTGEEPGDDGSRAGQHASAPDAEGVAEGPAASSSQLSPRTRGVLAVICFLAWCVVLDAAVLFMGF